MQDKYQKRLSEMVNQKVKILINRSDFQKDVILFRKRWKISQNGLRTDKANEKWYSWILGETDSYYDTKWPKETKKILELRNLKKYKEAEEIKKSIDSGAPLNALNNDVWVIVINYDLPPKWHGGIKKYLISDEPKDLSNQTGLTVSFNWDHGVMRPSIEFDKDTTLTDLKRVWSWARKMLKNKRNTKFQPIKNFDRDKEIYALQQKNRDWKEIAETISNKYGDELDYNDINIIIRRYKERFHIN